MSLQYEKMGRMSFGVRKVLDIFPMNQVKIIFLDDLKSDPSGLFNEVTEFLGLYRIELPDFPVINANKINKSRLVASISQREVHPLIRKPIRVAKRLLGLGSVSISGKLDQLNKISVDRAKLSREMRNKLGVIFSDEIAALEDLTGRDLEHWRIENRQ